MILIFIHILLQMYSVDTRVHCWDKKATKWIPLGFSCPVNCNNVISAINRLKLIDYETIITDTSYENAVDSIEQYIEQKKGSKEISVKNPWKILNTTYESAIIEASMKRIELSRKLNRRSAKLDCFKYYKMADKKGLNKCISLRNELNVNETIAIITETLSKYTHSNVTADVTKKIMTKMLGEEEVSMGKFAVKPVIKFLGRAFHAYEDLKKNRMVIQLRSQHCLTTYMPGCFCQTGYVEHFGRCIKPAECYNDKLFDQYINRIVIL